VQAVERGQTVGLTRRGKLVAIIVSITERVSRNGIGLGDALRAFHAEHERVGVFTARQIKALRDRRRRRCAH
jgi:antitoxin (DNA-binding transcriptional repressor) of toxin-antitoxin stability system